MVDCRMFVDALDAQIHDEHHQSGRCYLSLSKVFTPLLSFLVTLIFSVDISISFLFYLGNFHGNSFDYFQIYIQ